MTHHPATQPPAGETPWTIARVQHALTNETMIRRFLLDLTHAPAHRIMEVFTSWQDVAAKIEANTTGQRTPTDGRSRGTSQNDTSRRPGGSDADQP